MIDREEMNKFLAAKEEIVIDDDTKYVVNFAYSAYTGAKRLVVGKSVREIQNGPFYGCASLETVWLHPRNKHFIMEGDCLISDKDELALCIGQPHIPDRVKTAEMTCFVKEAEVETFYVGRSLERLTRALRNFNIKNIALSPENECFELEGNCLFYKGTGKLALGCENSVIPARTTEIMAEAFVGCNIGKVHIPANVTRIESMAFDGCRMLEELTFDEGIKRIEYCAFRGCESLADIDLPASLTFVNDGVFSGCGIRTITSPGGLTALSDNMFCGCDALEELVLTARVAEIGSGTFSECASLKSVKVSCNYIGDAAFADCPALKSAEIECRRCGGNLFGNCTSLETVTLPSSLKEVPWECFFNCTDLKKIELPKSVRTISKRAFYNCRSLESINVSRVADIAGDAFLRCIRLPKSMPEGKPLPAALTSERSLEQIREECVFGDELNFSYFGAEYSVIYEDILTYDDFEYLLIECDGEDFIIDINETPEPDGRYLCQVLCGADEPFEDIHDEAQMWRCG